MIACWIPERLSYRWGSNLLCLRWEFWIDLLYEPCICFLIHGVFRTVLQQSSKVSILYILILQSPIFISTECHIENHHLHNSYLCTHVMESEYLFQEIHYYQTKVYHTISVLTVGSLMDWQSILKGRNYPPF